MAESRDRPSARERIIEAYLRLLSQDSRKKVTVTAVAKSAGCNRDTFYYHFASIDDAARCAIMRGHTCCSSPRSLVNIHGSGIILR